MWNPGIQYRTWWWSHRCFEQKEWENNWWRNQLNDWFQWRWETGKNLQDLWKVTTVRHHVEANHITGVNHICDTCGRYWGWQTSFEWKKSFYKLYLCRTRNAARHHKRDNHIPEFVLDFAIPSLHRCVGWRARRTLSSRPKGPQPRSRAPDGPLDF